MIVEDEGIMPQYQKGDCVAGKKKTENDIQLAIGHDCIVRTEAGDVLLQLGDYKFVDVNSYMVTLGKFKKGDQTVLRIKRGAEEINIPVSF